MYDHLTAISTAMNTLGWSNYANDHEDGNGQFEQNFQFADALTTADRVVTLRYLLSMIAAERGMVATFMPKPFADRTGSGLHLHLSLTSGGTPVFPPSDDPRGLGLSQDRLRVHRRHPRTRLRAAGRGRANGQLLQANRRDDHRSGASWAPRSADATAATTAPTTSACPTISASSCAAATARPTRTWRSPRPRRGHRRHQARPDPGEAVPATGPDAAADAAARGRRVERGPGGHRCARRRGRGVAAYFAAVKREEFFDLPRAVTPWEIDQYLTAF